MSSLVTSSLRFSIAPWKKPDITHISETIEESSKGDSEVVTTGKGEVGHRTPILVFVYDAQLHGRHFHPGWNKHRRFMQGSCFSH